MRHKFLEHNAPEMNFGLFRKLPLSLRMALCILALFVVGVWALALTAHHLLQTNVLQTLSDQQSSAVAMLSAHVDGALLQRVAALDTVAKAIRVPLKGNPNTLLSRLPQLQTELPEFNGGIFITARDGTVIASAPSAPVRPGMNVREQAYIRSVLQSGKPAVSEPLRNMRQGFVLLALAVPVQDAGGGVIGTVTGLIDLGSPNFLWQLSHGGYGKSGSVLLVENTQRLVIGATDSSRVLHTLPSQTDMAKIVDRAIAQRPDFAIASNEPEVNLLVSTKRVPGTNWVAVIALPQREAWAPITALQWNLVWLAGFISLLIFAITWWLIQRGLAPLLAARHRADAANLAKSRFLAAMSHDIRTPMGGVLSMAQLLLMPNLGESERRDYARTIFSSGQSLIAILNDILDLSKIESEAFEPDNIVFSPKALLSETRNLFAIAARSKNLQLDCEWSGPPERRYCADAHRLRQMLNNLVSNAIKFTAHGHVRIEAREVGKHMHADAMLEFAVQDTGVGIAPDDIDQLFKPFSQLGGAHARQFGGSGLGLSIVRELALKMGGDAGVSVQAGEEGARIWFQIRAPIVDQGAESRRTERPHPTLPGTPGPTSTLMGHVLVVEDNPINCAVIQAMLRTIGVAFSVVHDGLSVVQVMEKSANIESAPLPDLILMDLDLPMISGYVATERIRQWEIRVGAPHTPIIALTADAFDAARQQCMAVGMDGFLPKPVSMSDLMDTLAQWLPTIPPLARPSAQGLKPLDVQTFLDQVNALIPLLEQNRFHAITRFHALQDSVKDTALEEPLEALAVPLNNMHFDHVREQLQNLASTLNTF